MQPAGTGATDPQDYKSMLTNARRLMQLGPKLFHSAPVLKSRASPPVFTVLAYGNPFLNTVARGAES